MKIGRNEDCPCGSGKKYKRCCNAKQRGFSDGTVRNVNFKHGTSNAGGVGDVTTFFGFAEETLDFIQAFSDESIQPACMVAMVKNDDEAKQLKRECGIDFNAGEWFLSTGGHDTDVKVYGPLEVNAALDLGREKHGVKKFFSEPEAF